MTCVDRGSSFLIRRPWATRGEDSDLPGQEDAAAHPVQTRIDEPRESIRGPLNGLE